MVFHFYSKVSMVLFLIKESVSSLYAMDAFFTVQVLGIPRYYGVSANIYRFNIHSEKKLLHSYSIDYEKLFMQNNFDLFS